MRVRMIFAAVLLAVTSLVGIASTASTAGAAASTSVDWPAYHGSANRSGWNRSMPRFTGNLHVVKRIALDGAVYAQPIVANGLTIVATENDTVYAFGPGNRLVWKRHLGTPAPLSSLPCGNIDPLGITGTPVYYPALRLIYVAAEFAGNPAYHRLVSIRVGNGRVVANRTLDLPGVDRVAMQERGALTVAGGRVWVPFGGLAGDCGGYKGRVIGYPIGSPAGPVRYTVPTAREAGIWTPPGPTVGPSGNLLVAVGNGASVPGDRYDHSDSVLRIGPKGYLLDSFSPTTWATDNRYDRDLGSQGPAIVQNRWVFAAGKSGKAYVLNIAHLGGIGGAVSHIDLCRSFGGTAVVRDVVYVPCEDGVRAVRIGPKGYPTVVWHAAGGTTGSPAVGGGVIWSLDPDAGVLHALGPFAGRSRASVDVGAVSRFATPALSGQRVLIGTMSGLTVVSY